MWNPTSTGQNTLVNTTNTALVLGFGPGQTAPPQMLVQNLSAGGTVTLPKINAVPPTPPATPGTTPGVGDGDIIIIKSISAQLTTIAAASGDTTDVALQSHTGDVTILQADAGNSQWRAVFNGSASTSGNTQVAPGTLSTPTLASTTRYLLVTTAGTVTLPATLTAFQPYAVINESNNSLTLTPASGTINTTASFTLATLKSTQFYSDGSNIHVLNTV